MVLGGVIEIHRVMIDHSGQTLPMFGVALEHRKEVATTSADGDQDAVQFRVRKVRQALVQSVAGSPTGGQL